MAGGLSGDRCMPENGIVLAKQGARRPSLRAPRGRHRGLLELGGSVGSQRLEPQLCVHEHTFGAVEIPAVGNDPNRISKPRGGLWTSTYEAEYGSAWVRWCVAYRYTDPFESHWTVMLAPEAARVETIDSSAMLAELIERYPRTLRGRRGLDFELLSRDYDCLHLTLEVICKRDQAGLAHRCGAGIANQRYGSGGFSANGAKSKRLSRMLMSTMTFGRGCPAGANRTKHAMVCRRMRLQGRFMTRCFEGVLRPSLEGSAECRLPVAARNGRAGPSSHR